jgi:uncharacterized Zn-finger protein
LFHCRLVAAPQTRRTLPLLINNVDGSGPLPSATHNVLTNQQTFPNPGLSSFGIEDDIPIPDFNHLPSSLEEENDNIHSNPLRSAIFQKILNSYPQLSRKLHRSHHMIKKFQETPRNMPTCLYQTPPSACSADKLAVGNVASDIMDDEGDNGYFSFHDNSSINSGRSISPNSPSADKLQHGIFDDVIVKNECLEFEEVFNIESTLDDLSQPCDLSVTKPVIRDFQPVLKPAKYQCPICKKTYKGNTNLNYHMATHTGIRPHKCSICGKAFTQKSTLRTHFRIHTGEKPYQCRTCSRAFADYSTCMKHERTHSGEKPYACPVCGKCFAQSGNMIRHRQIHTKRAEVISA